MRALEVMGQTHVHVEGGDRVLHPHALVFYLHRVTNTLNADLVNRQVAGVGHVLNVGNGG